MCVLMSMCFLSHRRTVGRLPGAEISIQKKKKKAGLFIPGFTIPDTLRHGQLTPPLTQWPFHLHPFEMVFICLAGVSTRL